MTTGERGPVGDSGQDGAAGRDGRDGRVGPEGKIGAEGPVGLTGERGASGPPARVLSRNQSLVLFAFVVLAFVLLAFRTEQVRDDVDRQGDVLSQLCERPELQVTCKENRL